MTPADSDLPFRHRQSTFRLYEPWLHKAIHSTNGEYVYINPAPHRPTTFAARLRDAKRSFEKFNWPATFSRLEYDLAESENRLVVAHSDHSVIIGPAAKRGPKSIGHNDESFQRVEATRISGIFAPRKLSQIELEAFCLLLSQKLLSGPLILEQNVSIDESSRLESIYDIAISEQNGKSVII